MYVCMAYGHDPCTSVQVLRKLYGYLYIAIKIRDIVNCRYFEDHLDQMTKH